MSYTREVEEKDLLDGGLKTLTIASKLENLIVARRFAEQAAEDCGFDEDAIFEIKLATGEAVANAVEHGSPKGRDNQVTVTCNCMAGNFLVSIEDEGQFKKYVAIATEPSYRGRGIHLMLAVMDRVTIHEKVNGTKVTLSKALPVQNQGPSQSTFF